MGYAINSLEPSGLKVREMRMDLFIYFIHKIKKLEDQSMLEWHYSMYFNKPRGLFILPFYSY